MAPLVRNILIGVGALVTATGATVGVRKLVKRRKEKKLAAIVDAASVVAKNRSEGRDYSQIDAMFDNITTKAAAVDALADKMLKEGKALEEDFLVFLAEKQANETPAKARKTATG